MNLAYILFSFEGRLRRRDFWIGTLIIWGVSLVAMVVLVAALWGPIMTLGEDEQALAAMEAAEINPFAAMEYMGPILGGVLAYFLFQAAIIWPSLALCVKRLHDRGQSGGWAALFVADQALRLVPVIGVLSWLGFRIYWLVNLGILDGTAGMNRFGVSPKGPTTAETFT